MKNFRKDLSLALVFTLIMSLFAVANVSAAQVNLPINFSDIVTYSFDITVPEGDILGIEFTAPGNIAATANLGWSYGSGSVKIADGKIQAGINWLDSGSATIVEPCADFPAGQVNNLMVRKNHRTGYTEFIANGVSFCKTTVKNKTLPITMLNVHGSGATTSKIETVFVKGTEAGELGAVAEHNEMSKEITVHFTEPLATETDLSATVLKNANTNATADIPLTATFDGKIAIFSYEGNLDNSAEYVVVFPDGITGVLGGTVKKFPKITTDASSLYQECDFNNGSAYIWKADVSNIQASGEEAYGNVLPFTTYDETGNYGKNIAGMQIPDSNVFSISFDVKVLVDTIKMGWTLWQEGGKSVTLGYGSSDGTASGNYTMLQIDRSNTNAGWLGSGTWQNKIGTYQNGQWINYKMEFNRTDKTVKVYVDNVLKTTVSIGADVTAAGSTTSDASGRTLYFAVVGNSGPTTSGTQFMWMDNFRVETIDESAVVSDVTFVDSRGEETTAFGTVSRLLDKVNVKFSSAMNADTLNDTTVNLYYNSEKVTCERTYDSATNTYTLSPATIPAANAEVKLMVEGAATSGNTAVSAYETKVTADNTASKFVVYEADAVDETDVKPLDGNLTTTKFKLTSYFPIMRAANYTDEAQQVRVIAAEYDDEGVLVNANISDPVTVNSGEYIRYGDF